ncbi:MAG TPA: carboxypeptidase regulatory-like domain-containing protein [Candidatus Thermoplasmatota archaeon]
MPKIVDAIVHAREPTILELTLSRPSRIRGLVWDPDAEAALEGAEVRLLGAEGNVLRATHTDAEGNYLFEGLRAGSYKVDLVTPTGFVTPTGTKTSRVGPNECVEVDFELRPGGLVRGRVVDEDTGEPLSDVNVVLLDAQGKPLRRVKTTTKGEYEFINLPEDRYQVAIGDESV